MPHRHRLDGPIARRLLITTAFFFLTAACVMGEGTQPRTDAEDVVIGLKTAASILVGAVIAAVAFGAERARIKHRLARLERAVKIPVDQD